MKIEAIAVHEIADSRGEPTIEVTLVAENGKEFSASVPSGKSRGSREARVFAPADAVKTAETIARALNEKDFNSVGELDRFLLDLDGTLDKSKLGGNVILGVSVAFSRALAAAEGRELWLQLRGEFFASTYRDTPPRIYSNLINGGAHANNNLDIQEYLVVVTPTPSVRESVAKLTAFYNDLGGWLQQSRELTAIRLGDEGGYSLDFENNFAPLKILGERIRTAHLENEFALGMDAAASGFFADGGYVFEKKKISSDALAATYARYAAEEPLLYSMEDPFDEHDAARFAALRRALPRLLVVGDDLTVTDPRIIARHAAAGAINAVIIKPNQIGTVSEACDAIRAAREHKTEIIISHRSGETDDPFIIHLARACGADGVKIGAPVSHRLPKFNELTRVYP
ncbi:MAG: hypothetical protein V1656_01205 [Candidatus Jorgensenbacteria bacterium]